METFNLGGRLISIEKPLIMGILNVTPDSFYDGGVHDTTEKAISQVQKMITDGADIIDVGAVSTRPNAVEVPVDEELKRLKPIIKEILIQFPDAILSVDTFRSKVVNAISELTPFILNDITGGRQDAELLPAVARIKCPYILMHMQGTPANMQNAPTYADVTMEMIDYFSKKVNELGRLGIDQVILDPGFGFGKTIEHNYTLLNKLSVFKIFECPILVGLSRKSMIYKVLESTSDTALNGTTALNMVALINGVKILRVHDVKQAAETRTLWQQLQ